MNAFAGRAAQAVTSIRVRLAVALCVALLPVLVLGGLQSIFAFRAENDARRQSLELAAGHSATIARARIEAAGVLLQTLGPGSVGLECAQRLADVTADTAGVAALTYQTVVVGDTERFTLVRNADGTVSLRSVAGGRYVTAMCG